MICDQNSVDLEGALHFQHEFAQVVINALEGRFDDNKIVSFILVLNPTNMPFMQVGLASWEVTNLEQLCLQYGVEKKLNNKELAPFINLEVACERKFSI